jgi:hypothetical protein
MQARLKRYDVVLGRDFLGGDESAMLQLRNDGVRSRPCRATDAGAFAKAARRLLLLDTGTLVPFDPP